MKLNEDTLLSYLHETLSVSDVRVESTLFSSGLLDSVSMVNLLTFIEQAGGIVIRAEDVTLQNFDTPARILRFVEAAA